MTGIKPTIQMSRQSSKIWKMHKKDSNFDTQHYNQPASVPSPPNLTSVTASIDTLVFPIKVHLPYVRTKPRITSFLCQLSQDDQPEKCCSRSVDDVDSTTTAAHHERGRLLSLSRLVLCQRFKGKSGLALLWSFRRVYVLICCKNDRC